MSETINYSSEVYDDKKIGDLRLGKLIADVETLVGTDDSLLRREGVDPKQTIDRQDIANERKESFETTMGNEEIVKFQVIVKGLVQKYRIQREHLLRDRGIVGADIDYFVDQLNMRTTLWQLEEEMLKRHLENLKKCAEFKGELPDPRPERQVDAFDAKLPSQQLRVFGKEYYDWERQAKNSLREIQQLLPVLQLVHRIVDAGEMLPRADGSTVEGKTIHSAYTELRKHLPEPGTVLSGALEGIQFDKNTSVDDLEMVLWELERRLRERSGETVEMRLLGEGQGTEVEIATAMYLRLLTNRRFHVINTMDKRVENSEEIPVELFTEFVDTQKEIHDLVIDFRAKGMKRHMDRFSLLVTRDAVAPGVTGDRLQPHAPLAQYLMDFYREVVVPGDIAEALKGEEVTRHAEGLRTYMKMVTQDMAEYKNRLVQKEKELWEDWPKEQKEIETTKGYIGWTYVMPEMTVGWYRTLSGGLLDYRKLTGEGQEWQNFYDVKRLMGMGIDAANLETIEMTHVPKLMEIQSEVEADIQIVMGLLGNQGTSPENFVNLPQTQQDDVRIEYAAALQALEEHRGQFAAELNAMYEAYDATLYEHVRRGTIHENLINENLPDYGLVALGTNVGTAAYLTALWAYGGRGGVRSIPRWGRIFRPFINQPDRWYNRPLLVRGVKGAANAPGRILNAHTRVIMDPIDFVRWAMGNPRERALHDYTSHEQVRELTRRFDKQVVALQREVHNLYGAGHQKIAQLDALEARIAALEHSLEQSLMQTVSPEQYETLQKSLDEARQAAADIEADSVQKSAEATRVITVLQSEVQQVKLECFKNELRSLLAHRDAVQALEEGAAKTAAVAKVKENVQVFMQRFNAFADGPAAYAPARAELAEIVMGHRLSPAEIDGLSLAHETDGLFAKFHRLRDAVPNYYGLSKAQRAALRQRWYRLAEMGLIGKTQGADSALQALEVLEHQRGLPQVGKIESFVTAAERARWYRRLAGNLDQLTPLQRAVRLGGIGLQGAMFGLHALSLRSALEFQAESRNRMQEDLEKLASGENPKLSFEQRDGETVYYYPPNATTDARKFSITLRKLQEPANVGIGAEAAHTAVSGLGLLAWMRYAKGVNPAGLAILGIEITVNTGINAEVRSVDYKLIEDFPLWLVLALGGTPGTVNESEFNLIDETVSDYLIPLGNVTGLFDGEKSLEVRKRLFLLSFAETLAQSDPELFQHMQMTMGGLPGVMEYIEKEEFGSFVGPEGGDKTLDCRIITNAFFSQLLVDADVANVQWNSLHRFEVDQWASLIGLIAKVPQEKFTEVFRTVIDDFFAPHMWTKLYLQAKADHDASSDPVEKAILAERMYQFGQKNLYGKRLMDIAPELESIRDRYAKEKNGYSTIVTPQEVLAKKFHDTISGAVPSGEGSFSGWKDLLDTEQDAWERSTDSDALERSRENPNDSIGRFTDMEVGEKKGGKIVKSTEPVAALTSTNRNFYIDVKDPKLATLLQLENGETDIIWFRNESMRSTKQSLIPPSEPALVPMELRGEDRGDFAFDHEKERAIALAADVRSMEKDLWDKLALIRELSQHTVETVDGKQVVQYLNGGPPTMEMQREFGELYSDYLVTFQVAEQDAKAIVAYEKESRGVTEALRIALSGGATRHALESVRPDDVIAEEYFGGEIPPVVMTSGISLPRDRWALDAVLGYPVMTGGPTFGPENLFSVYVQREVGKKGAESAEDRILATFTYVNPYSANVNRDGSPMPYFVQIAATRKNAEGEYAYAMALPLYDDVLAKSMGNDIYNRSKDIRESWYLMNKKEILAEMTEAERMFWAGENPGQMRQIAPNLWGMRSESGKEYILIRQKGDRTLEKITHKVGQQSDVTVDQWVETLEAHRETGSTYLTTRLTEGEKKFAADLQTAIAVLPWVPVVDSDDPIYNAVKRAESPFHWSNIPKNQLVSELIAQSAPDLQVLDVRGLQNVIDFAFTEIDKKGVDAASLIRHQFYSHLEANLGYVNPRNVQELLQVFKEAAQSTNDGGILYNALDGLSM